LYLNGFVIIVEPVDNVDNEKVTGNTSICGGAHSISIYMYGIFLNELLDRFVDKVINNPQAE
jgi:hypothetical protein